MWCDSDTCHNTTIPHVVLNWLIDNRLILPLLNFSYLSNTSNFFCVYCRVVLCICKCHIIENDIQKYLKIQICSNFRVFFFFTDLGPFPGLLDLLGPGPGPGSDLWTLYWGATFVYFCPKVIYCGNKVNSSEQDERAVKFYFPGFLLLQLSAGCYQLLQLEPLTALQYRELVWWGTFVLSYLPIPLG